MPFLILLFGGLVALALISLGAKLRYGQAYWMIAGYNTASPEVKKQYDIEGLSHHIGNGLTTMGVFLVFATVAAARDNLTWCLSSMGLFVGVAFLVVVGGRKFMPNAPTPGEHRLLKAIVPERAFNAMRAGTRNWLIECKCGHRTDYWEAGGVRYKAVGERRELRGCPSCAKLTWHRVRRKTEAERELVA